MGKTSRCKYKQGGIVEGVTCPFCGGGVMLTHFKKNDFWSAGCAAWHTCPVYWTTGWKVSPEAAIAAAARRAPAGASGSVVVSSLLFVALAAVWFLIGCMFGAGLATRRMPPRDWPAIHEVRQ